MFHLRSVSIWPARRNASSQVQLGEQRGIVVGNAIDGSLLAFVPDSSDLGAVGAGASASGIAADAMGNAYAADVGAHIPSNDLGANPRFYFAERYHRSVARDGFRRVRKLPTLETTSRR
jgi:hypothetical protein